MIFFNTVEAWRVFCNHPYVYEVEGEYIIISCHYCELYFAFQEVHCHVNKAIINKTSSKNQEVYPRLLDCFPTRHLNLLVLIYHV